MVARKTWSAAGFPAVGAKWAAGLVAVLLVACTAGEETPSHAAARRASWHYCTITFGAVLSMPGAVTGEGQQLRDAYDLLRRRVNRSGGFDIGGKRCLIEVIYDDHSDPRSAADQVHHLVAGRAVNFVLGRPTKTGSDLTVSERYGVPMLEGSLSADAALASLGIATCGTEGDRSDADGTSTSDGCISQQASDAAGRLYAFQQAIEAAGSVDPAAVHEELIRLGAVDQ